MIAGTAFVISIALQLRHRRTWRQSYEFFCDAQPAFRRLRGSPDGRALGAGFPSEWCAYVKPQTNLIIRPFRLRLTGEHRARDVTGAIRAPAADRTPAIRCTRQRNTGVSGGP